MEFLKKNYEKVLLGLVLLGLTVSAALLPFIISGKRNALEEARNVLTNPKIKELPPLDLTRHETAMTRAQAPVRLNFSGRHNLINPVLWQKTPEGRIIKVNTGSEVAGGVEVTGITELYLNLSFDSASGGGYLFGVQREAAARPDQRGKRQTLAKLDAKNDYFTLREVKGTAENPTGFLLELGDTGEKVTVAPAKPYKRVDGYSADLKYAPENKTWRNQRMGMSLTFGGDQYNIVAITQSNVVLSAKQNEKKTTLNFVSSSEPR
jgi:hypothetical protein